MHILLNIKINLEFITIVTVTFTFTIMLNLVSIYHSSVPLYIINNCCSSRESQYLSKHYFPVCVHSRNDIDGVFARRDMYNTILAKYRRVIRAWRATNIRARWNINLSQHYFAYATLERGVIV